MAMMIQEVVFWVVTCHITTWHYNLEGDLNTVTTFTCAALASLSWSCAFCWRVSKAAWCSCRACNWEVIKHWHILSHHCHGWVFNMTMTN